ncbi:MAG TPA: KH domain-containing protein [Candidatus Paceibacterota bacterium]|nr:KH domain-containing protein [Candidatus Paceibacterota bacterium]
MWSTAVEFKSKFKKGIMVQEAVDKQILELIVKSIVNHPDEVKIDRKVDEMGVLLNLKVHPEDMGQIIGRGGSMSRALRTILKVVGAKNRARVNLKIEEPPVSASSKAEKTADEIVEDLKI